MIHIIYLHLMVNAFLTGLYYPDIIERSNNSRIRLAFVFLFVLITADFLHIGFFMYYLAGNIIKDSYIGFCIDWHTGYYEKMPVEDRNNIIAVSKWKVALAENNGDMEKSVKWKRFRK